MFKRTYYWLTRRRRASGRTQRITAADISSGRIRIPSTGNTKRLFPPGKGSIELRLRGRSMVTRWDPRYGPDRERSGVISLKRDLLAELVTEDEVLRVTTDRGVFVLE